MDDPLAVTVKSIQVVKVLLQQGADPNIADDKVIWHPLLLTIYKNKNLVHIGQEILEENFLVL